MTNQEIVKEIKTLAALMALADENPFKVRAFENAARVLSAQEQSIADLVRQGRLEKLPGIGKSTAALVKELVETGRSSTLERYKQQIPPGVLDILNLPGLGVKKVQALWSKLGIADLGELEYACTENRLLKLKGFGPKVQERVLAAIRFARRFAGNFLADEAASAAQEWERLLSKVPIVMQVAITGQVRRALEIVSELELVVALDPLKPDKLVPYLREIDPKLEYEVRDHQISWVSETGLKILVHCTAQNAFIPTLVRTTGSAEHVNWLEEVATRHGLTFGEKTLEDVSGPVSLTDELDFYQRLELPYFPPELREPEATSLPEELLEFHHIHGLFHVHTTYSDGLHSLREMVEAARDAGYRFIGISDHSQSAYYAHGLSPDQVREQWAEIEALNEEFEDILILKGIESDILHDGSLDYDEELLAGFDFVIASVHSHFSLDRGRQTDRICRALASPYTTMLGHPTGRLLLSRPAYALDLEAVLRTAAEYGKAIELNSSPRRLDLDWRWLARARELGVPIAINPDAHSRSMLQSVPLGVRMARKGGLTPADVWNCLPPEKVLSVLRSKRK